MTKIGVATAAAILLAVPCLPAAAQQRDSMPMKDNAMKTQQGTMTKGEMDANKDKMKDDMSGKSADKMKDGKPDKMKSK